MSNGVATLVSNGNGMAGSSDNFRFAYRSLRGDGEIIAKVTSVQWTNPMARAAIMFRNSLASNSKSAFLAIMPNGSAQWSFRRTDGANAQQTNISNQAAPRYVKLVRFGSLITASVSANKVSWTQIGQANITMDENVYVGLALSASEYYGGYNTSTFEEVTASANPNPLPAGWTSQDIGSAPMAGTSRFTDDTYIFTVEGSGQLVGGTSDSLHFAHRTLVGDGEIIAKVTSIVGMDGNPSGYNQYAMAGVMFRDGVASNARTVLMAITGWDGARWQYRSATGGNSTEYKVAGIGVPHWVRIKRVGNDFTGYRSADGINWTPTGSTVTISNMPSSLEVGLTFNAAAYGSLNTATFEGVKMVPAAPSLAATANHAHRIDLSWTDNSSSEDGFSIERRADGGAWQVATTISGSNAWIDNGVEPGVEYDYRVRAFITGVTGGNSEHSNIASAHTTGLGDGLTGTYFDNTDFTGATLSRVDERVDFRWDAGVSPGEGIEPPTFAVEWTGQVQTPNETNPSDTYTFNTYSDDGIMLWVNGQLLIDHFDVHAPGSDNATIDLAPNQKYNLRILYFQNAGSGDAHLNWIVPGGALEPVSTANLFSAIVNPPAAPGTPVVTSAEAPGADNPNSDLADYPRVDLAWQSVAGAERYVIFRSADNGITYTVAGSVDAAMTHFTDTDEGRYLDGQKTYRYQVMAVSAGGRSQLAEALDGIDAVDAYRTGDGAVVTWDATVDGTVRIDRSTDGGDTWVTVADGVDAEAGSVADSSVPPTGDGTYVVVMCQPMLEGVANASDGSLEFVQNPVRATFFSGTDLSGTSMVTTLDGLSRTWDDRTPVPGGFPVKNFSARMEGSVVVPATGNYTFHVKANGGVRLFVEGQRVVDRWNDIPMFGGDVNEDGATDFFDLTTIAANYGLVPATRAQGDANGDGAVNFFDTTLLASQYGQKEVPHTVDLTVSLLAGQRLPVWVEYFNAQTRAFLEVTWTVPGGTEAQSLPLEPLGSATAPYPVEFSLASGGSVNEGQITTINLSAAPAAGQDPVIGWWIDWGGTQQYLSADLASAEYSWPDNGAMAVRAWAVGQTGLQYPATAVGGGSAINVTVANLAPVLEALAAGAYRAGDLAVINLSIGDPGKLDTHTATINWGDGVAETVSVLESAGQGVVYADHIYNGAGTFAPIVTIADDDGASTQSTADQVISNAAPVLATFASQAITEGDEARLFVPFTDADTADTHTAVIDWGDSTVEPASALDSGGTGSVTASHVYDQDGLYTVTLTLTDYSGASSSHSAVVAVANAAPRADAGLVHRGTAGTSMTLGGDLFDPGVNDDNAFLWELRDNAGQLLFSATTQDLTFTAPPAGTYWATFTVTDDGATNNTGSATTRVLIGNVGDPIDTTIPTAPSALTLGSVSPDAVSLSWLDQSNDEDGFSIEWSGDGIDYYIIDVVAAGMTTYSDAFPIKNRENRYRVRAFRDDYESQPTDYVVATPVTAPVAFYDDNGGYNGRGTLSPFAVIHEQVLAGNVFGNDVDFANLPFQVASVSQPSHGSLSLNADGSFIYTPDYAFVGTDNFTYTISNSQFTSQPADVAIDVTNALPRVSARELGVADITVDGITYHHAAEGTLEATDPDEDGTEIRIASYPRLGVLDFDAQTGHFLYVPGPDFRGYDCFTYYANDGFEDGQAAPVEIVDHSPPAGGNSAFFVYKNSAFAIHEGAVDYRVAPGGEPSHGQIVTSPGGVEYVPNHDYVGDDVVRLELHEGNLVSKPWEIKIRVGEQYPDPNGPPPEQYASPGTIYLPIPGGIETTLSNAVTRFVPADRPAARIVVQDNPQHGKIDLSSTGGFTYTPNDDELNYRGWDYFSFRYTNASMNTAPNWIVLDVGAPNPVGDPPPPPAFVPEKFPKNLKGLWSAYIKAKDSIGKVLQEIANLGQISSTIAQLSGDPSEAIQEDAVAALDRVSSAFDRYSKRAQSAMRAAGDYMKSVYYTSQADFDVLNAINSLPTDIAALKPTKQQMNKWRGALANFTAGADFMVANTTMVVQMAKDTHDALQVAMAAGGGAALAINGFALATQQGCTAFVKAAMKHIAVAEVFSLASQSATALARKFGVNEDYIRIGADAIQVASLIKAARAQRKAETSCFVAGTEVLTGSAQQPGVFGETRIEDIRKGDLVWSRDQNDPDARLELKRVTQVFSHRAYDLQTLSVADDTGNTDVLHVTDTHPFYVSGAGWTGAASLRVGDHLFSADDQSLTVTGNADDKPSGGVMVYNFEVEGSHTYFVDDSFGEESYVWVHNSCDPLQNKANHIFGKPEHKLDPVVTHFGSDIKALQALQGTTTAHVKARGITGLFEEVVSIAGHNVTVRGNVIAGEVKIATAFIP